MSQRQAKRAVPRTRTASRVTVPHQPRTVQLTSAGSRYTSEVAGYSHVLESGGGLVTSIGPRRDVNEFAKRLRRFNGEDLFALCVWALPPGMDYDQAVDAGSAALEYVQAAGRSDQLTVEIRKPGGTQWGAEWVRYVVGHPHDGNSPLDVPIVLPGGTELISAPEVFEAEEAARLLYDYYKSGDIPSAYTLRAVQGFTRAGTSIDLRDGASPVR